MSDYEKRKSGNFPTIFSFHENRQIIIFLRKNSRKTIFAYHEASAIFSINLIGIIGIFIGIIRISKILDIYMIYIFCTDLITLFCTQPNPLTDEQHCLFQKIGLGRSVSHIQSNKRQSAECNT